LLVSRKIMMISNTTSSSSFSSGSGSGLVHSPNLILRVSAWIDGFVPMIHVPSSLAEEARNVKQRGHHQLRLRVSD
jgi:hypothetical protein